jgi:hypothetical protein
MTPQTEFFAHLAEAMTSLLNGVLKESAFALFRRSPEVVFGGPSGVVSPDFHLNMIGRSINESDKGTFNVPLPPDRFVVYRVPARVTASFTLVGRGIPAITSLKAYDKLYSYFFDHRSLEPFVPEGYRRRSGLYERLLSQKAEIKVRPDVAPITSGELFQFTFDYLALYHSGNPLREEVRTKQRVIEYSNDPNERSVL